MVARRTEGRRVSHRVCRMAVSGATQCWRSAVRMRRWEASLSTGVALGVRTRDAAVRNECEESKGWWWMWRFGWRTGRCVYSGDM